MYQPPKEPENQDQSDNQKGFFNRFDRDYKFGYRGTSHLSRKILWISLIFFIIALLWAYFAIIDEVTVAHGKVIPSKQIQVIQNLEGGIVKQILVRPGEVVKQGQILAYLDNTRLVSDYNSAKRKATALKIRIARFEAEVNNRPLIIPPDLQKAHPELSTTEMTLYHSRMNQLEAFKRRKASISKEIAMTTPLIKEGVVSNVDLLHLQQSLEELNGQMLAFSSTALDELNKTKAELATLEQDMFALEDRLDRTTIRSPVNGIINQIYVNTVGGVIKPGENLIDIVPMDDTLLIEAKVRPADIGFIHPNQEATVKITAYDFSIYGGLKGTVEHISADTIKDEKGDNYYHIKVRTQQNYIQGRDKRLYIIPGMTASVDILTGRKSVLDYVLKPIIKAKQSALRER